MFTRMFYASCLAGTVAGLVLTGVQSVTVTPLIQQAETYESVAGAAVPHRHGDVTHTHVGGALAHDHDGQALVLAPEALPHTHGGMTHSHPNGAVVHGHDLGPVLHRHGELTHSHAAGQIPHEHAAADAHGAAGHDQAWAPADGTERLAWTAVANVGIAIGFALILAAVFAWRGAPGWRQGLLWGAVGYVAFFASPALGLHPEVPGTFAAALAERQGWWLLAVACTAIGLGVAVTARRIPVKLAGLALLVVPHALGAPHPEVAGGIAPGTLAEQFVSATGVANAVFWLVLGLATAVAYRRLVR